MRRRNFLQMLGFGGASLLVTTAAKASPVVPLFSGKESKIWTPEHANLTRSHLVLTRPKTVVARATPAPGGAQWGMWLNRNLWPKIAGTTLQHTDEIDLPSVGVRTFDGADPHEAFYKASMEMRTRFTEQSKKRLLDVPEYRRPNTMLVTLVDNPIFAAPPRRRGEDGFDLEISYTPYALWNTDDIELNGWEVYSENGEFPMEIPTDIDMDFLMRVDTQIFTGKKSLLQLRGKIITL